MRRALLALLALALGAAPTPRTWTDVRPGVELGFPTDHGAHPRFRTEWWYVTGWLRTANGQDLGFQVTFFRAAPPTDPGNPSAFAPTQILFAHAALSDPARGRLIHDSRAARAGFGLAQAATRDADVAIRDWRLRRAASGRFETQVAARGFTLALALAPRQPILLQGDRGYSRKGPLPSQASHYYSMPHLAVTGTIVREGRREAVTGTAWLDREWSTDFLGRSAAGWDWTGINLDDGGALMAFRIRDRAGGTLWAGGTLRRADGALVRFAPGDVSFAPRRRWRSPRTGARYPVDPVVSIRLPEGVRRFALAPLFDDQELDGRAGGLPVYWEGAVRTPGGRGYLELTGYVAPLRM